MPTTMEKPWAERRESMLADLIQLIYYLDQDNVPHVPHNIDYVYVHFYNEDGKDIGNLALANGLHSLYNDVYIFPDSSSECDDIGEPVADLDIREAVRLDIQGH